MLANQVDRNALRSLVIACVLLGSGTLSVLFSDGLKEDFGSACCGRWTAVGIPTLNQHDEGSGKMRIVSPGANDTQGLVYSQPLDLQSGGVTLFQAEVDAIDFRFDLGEEVTLMMAAISGLDTNAIFWGSPVHAKSKVILHGTSRSDRDEIRLSLTAANHPKTFGAVLFTGLITQAKSSYFDTGGLVLQFSLDETNVSVSALDAAGSEVDLHGHYISRDHGLGNALRNPYWFVGLRSMGAAGWRATITYDATQVCRTTPTPLRIWKAVEIGWDSKEDILYQLQWAPRPDGPWHDLGLPVTGTGGLVTRFDTTRGAERRYYRTVPAPGDT